MNSNQKKELTGIATQALDGAEGVWGEVGERLVAFSASANESLEKRAETSQIPGYPVVEDGVPVVDEFICIVADLRNSTKHLLVAISSKQASVSQLQRVFYETSALLPTIAQVIAWHDGSVTEYLGDGVLGLFKASPDRDQAIYAALHAAQDSLTALSTIINPLLHRRYGLPNLEIGIGMGYSKAVVTLMGLDTYKQPKVFGECVFRASKLASEANAIIVDEALKMAWPRQKGGKLTFTHTKVREVDGYIIE